jgi:ubiquinone/menaquinone biosynthesis C-methylase UbiE
MQYEFFLFEKNSVLCYNFIEVFSLKNVISHYDLLIDENNDPVHDPLPLREYMDRWDGESFIDLMELDGTKSVLEIGVGTGRLAVRTAPKCGEFYGVDISPKTVLRAKENLSAFGNVQLITGDFMDMDFCCTFDVVYSSLTFMHFEDKMAAVQKISALLFLKVLSFSAISSVRLIWILSNNFK